MRYFTLLILTLYFLPMPAKAQQTGALISGAYLMKMCERDQEGKEIIGGGSTVCQAYIAGLVDYHNLLRSLGTSPSVDLCVPNTVKMNDLQSIVYTYLSQNKQHDAFIAAPAVSLALFEVFPCKRTRKKK